MNNEFYYRVNDRDGRLQTVQLTIPNITKINNYLNEQTTEIKKIMSKITESIDGLNKILKDVIYKDAFSTEKYGNIINKLDSIIKETDIYSLFDFGIMSQIALSPVTLPKVAKDKREKACDDAYAEITRQMGLIYSYIDKAGEDDMYKYYEKKYDQLRVVRDEIIPAARRGFYDK